MDLKIALIAHELALKFENESDIPTRFKKGKLKKSSEPNLESKVEKIFQQHVLGWMDTIKSILDNVNDQNQAWRFILNEPKISESSLESVTKCRDFLDFADLLTQRRNIDNCSDTELGNLCFLLNSFQKKIEKVTMEYYE